MNLVACAPVLGGLGMHEGRRSAGYYLVSERQPREPGRLTLWLGAEPHAVLNALSKMRADGFELDPIGLDCMSMKVGRDNLTVWLEREDGARVALASLLS